jgi:hypothetical protein
MQHTNHGLHVNKEGKSWIANNLVKEIKDLFLPSRVPLPIVLPWKNANYNIPYMSQLIKGSVNEDPTVIVDQNSEHQGVSRNMERQKTETSAEYVHEVPLVTTLEGSNLGMTVDGQENGINVAGKQSRINNDSQEVAKTRKSARLKKHLNSKKQDFLW